MDETKKEKVKQAVKDMSIGIRSLGQIAEKIFDERDRLLDAYTEARISEVDRVIDRLKLDPTFRIDTKQKASEFNKLKEGLDEWVIETLDSLFKEEKAKLDALIAILETEHTKTPAYTGPMGSNPFKARLTQDEQAVGYQEGETAHTLRNPATGFILSAVLHGGGDWKRKANGWGPNQFDIQVPQFDRQHISGKGSTWRATIDRETGDTSELWDVVERFGPLHVQTMLFVLACMGDPKKCSYYPMRGSVTVDIEDLLRAKNIQRRGKDRETLRREVAQCMKDLQSIRLDVRNVTVLGRQGRRLANCALFDVAEIYDDWFTDGTSYPRAWILRTGIWGEFWFNQDNGTAHWVGAMARTLMELDHRKNRKADGLAMAIAARYLFCSGGTNYLNYPQTMTVAELLAGVGYLLEEHERPPHWADRLYQTLDRALEALKDGGLLADCTKGTTSAPYPGIGDTLARGWVRHWLDADITLVARELAAKLPEPAPIAAPVRRVRRVKKPAHLLADAREHLDKQTVVTIRDAMGRRGLSQAATARLLNISAPHFSNVLNGTRKPDPDLLTRIRDFLNNPA